MIPKTEMQSMLSGGTWPWLNASLFAIENASTTDTPWSLCTRDIMRIRQQHGMLQAHSRELADDIKHSTSNAKACVRGEQGTNGCFMYFHSSSSSCPGCVHPDVQIVDKRNALITELSRVGFCAKQQLRISAAAAASDRHQIGC